MKNTRRKKSVLLVDPWIYTQTGGGQHCYKRIIEATPEIQYFCPKLDDSKTEKYIPDNVRLFNSKLFFFSANENVGYNTFFHNHYEMYIDGYITAMNLAYSFTEEVGLKHIDVVDVPDYLVDRLFMKHALNSMGVQCDQIVVAMHGTIEESLDLVWPPARPDRRNGAKVRLLSRMMNRAADQRYALSETYANDWRRRSGVEAQLIDPTFFLDDRGAEYKPTETCKPPELIFAGRMERRKGPDLAIDLAWCLPKDSFSRLLMIGSNQIDQGIGNAKEGLQRLASERGVNIAFPGTLPQSDLHAKFRDRSVVLLPSRYDTYNLVALEALSFGCPVFVSKTMGFADWLRSAYPELSFLILDFDSSRKCADVVSETLRNYDERRQEIIDALSRKKIVQESYKVDHIYSGTRVYDEKAKKKLDDLFIAFHSQFVTQAHMPDEIRQVIVRNQTIGALIPNMGRELGAQKSQPRLNDGEAAIANGASACAPARALSSEMLGQILRLGRGSRWITPEDMALFSKPWYAMQAAELSLGLGSNLDHHFINVGGPMGLSPHPFFDPEWYLSKYPDVRANGMHPWRHYLRHGRDERRLPHPTFDMYHDWQKALFLDSPLKFFEITKKAFDDAFPNLAQRLPSRREADEIVNEIAAKLGAFSLGEHYDRLMPPPNIKNNSREFYLARLTRHCENLQDLRGGRAVTFREMARLAREIGDDVLAAVYHLRSMRLFGEDRYGDLAYVLTALNENGYGLEADAAFAMFDDPALSQRRVRAFLDTREAMHKTKELSRPTLIDDRRGSADATVSVIVSMYNAESKLPLLLDNLSVQTLAKDGRMEIVLVDSNSPTDERRVFKEFAERSSIPTVYLRSKDRETIQHAWNRGIELARGPYLCFLGCDEGLHPECLEKLAGALDQAPNVDWITADSVVTDVDRDALFSNDIMTYKRTGYHHEITRFDTCYMNYVGGLYRRSIHDRFGFYDEGFRGAGDTEFKLRLMRHLNSVAHPDLLGVFNNHQEERTTQSPMAELEDMRAWYIHRTVGGIEYGFRDKPDHELEKTFKAALGYRKSYCRHISTDFGLAHSVATYWAQRSPENDLALAAKKSADRLYRVIRQIDGDYPIVVRSTEGAEVMLNAAVKLEAYAREDAVCFKLKNKPSYRLWNDNRHEQHAFPWFPKA